VQALESQIAPHYEAEVIVARWTGFWPLPLTTSVFLDTEHESNLEGL
jgi:hypothetical protein